ncbi:MAG TPA: S41 family peptidase, partial [Gillisia sp.]|nr:S41 family peptidase [Gillisia sp.]
IKETTSEVTEENDKLYEEENFIYRVMSDIYLYKKDVPVLADNYFSSTADKYLYFDKSSSPDALFDKLVASHDDYSYLHPDYREMNKTAAGTRLMNGMGYGLVAYCDSCNDVFGYVRFVFPNSVASEQGVERGMIFNRVNGQQLTRSNINSLLSTETFTIGLAKIEGNQISNLDRTISLTARQQLKNPIIISKTFNVDGIKVGYLFYESFNEDFDEELNQAFGNFKNEGISELILDLRYNGGGNVRTAIDLAGLITGQFPGQVFMKERWNDKYQKYYEEREPESLLNRFNTTTRSGTALNSLNLNRIFVLATKSSASASELIINGLDPYIDVVHIGTATTGKFQASAPLYDSPDYDKKHSALNKNHFYAVQPLILKSANVNDVSDYVNGLNPDIVVEEDVLNLGPLGDPNELLIKVAIDVIKGNRTSVPYVKPYPAVGESGMFEREYKEMYIDTKTIPVIKQ